MLGPTYLFHFIGWIYKQSAFDNVSIIVIAILVC